jgi:hypothetical protein
VSKEVYPLGDNWDRYGVAAGSSRAVSELSDADEDSNKMNTVLTGSTTVYGATPVDTLRLH